MSVRISWKPLLVSLLLTPVCLFLAIASGGAGHGNYFFAKLLFPYTMLATLLFNSITTPLMLLALVQFPLYGAILSMTGANEKLFQLFSIGLLTVHLFAVILCFLLLNESFS